MATPRTRPEAMLRLAEAIAEEARNQKVLALMDADLIRWGTILYDDALNEHAKRVAKGWFPGRAEQIETCHKSMPLIHMVDAMGL